jgi:hypothetical protein
MRIGTAFLSILACTQWAPAQGTEDIRIFFDATQTKPNGSLTEHPGPLAFENPVVQSGERLNIYAEFLDEQQWWTVVMFDVEVDGGVVTHAHYFNALGQVNYPVNGSQRWAGAQPNPPSMPRTDRVRFGAVAAGYWGLESGPGARSVEPLQYRRPEEDGGSVAGTTLLGYIDVALDPGVTAADVFLTIGDGGIIHANGLERAIFFGFGDAALHPNQRHVRTDIHDAVVIPEPPSILLLAGAALAVCRRGLTA